MKKILYLVLALSLCACVHKPKSAMTFEEKLIQLHQYIEDSTLSFADYEPLFVDILDTLEFIVNNSEDADERFIARQLPTKILASICLHNSKSTCDSIWHMYDQRREEILTTWYVQQLIDSTDNTPFIIMSYAAPFDDEHNETHVGFSFLENSKPDVEPVMIITLPDSTDDPIILFSLWDDTHITKYKEYYARRCDMKAIADNNGTYIFAAGDILKDMLWYQEIKVCYFHSNYDKNLSMDENRKRARTIRIPFDLHQFQVQYEAAHQWLISQ